LRTNLGGLNGEEFQIPLTGSRIWDSFRTARANLGIIKSKSEAGEPHLRRRQIEGEARIAVPPLRADAGEPPPDPRRRPRHHLRCSTGVRTARTMSTIVPV